MSDPATPQPTPEQQPSEATPPPPVAPPQAADQSFLTTALQVAQRTWVGLRPTVIQALRGLTGQLQRLTQTLETQEAQHPSPSQPIDFTPIVSLSQVLWTKLQPIWQLLIGKIRPRLPEALQGLSDRALSGMLAGVFLLLFWITSSLPAGRAATPPTPPPASTIARQFPADVPTQKTAPFPQDLSASDRRSPTSQPVPITPPISAPQSAPTAPSIASRTPSASETPIAQLSPEQILLAFLQEPLQDSESLSQFPLLTSVQPNPQTQQLRVTIAPTWYSLDTSVQDQLAALLLQQSQQKDFSQLELMDGRGNLLARSPIVGTDMVILKRR